MPLFEWPGDVDSFRSLPFFCTLYSRCCTIFTRLSHPITELCDEGEVRRSLLGRETAELILGGERPWAMGVVLLPLPACSLAFQCLLFYSGLFFTRVSAPSLSLAPFPSLNLLSLSCSDQTSLPHLAPHYHQLQYHHAARNTRILPPHRAHGARPQGDESRLRSNCHRRGPQRD